MLERTCAQTGETASLAVPGMGGLTYVDEVTPTAVLTASWLGRSVPLHATSTGKALLAFLPAEQVRRVLAGALTAFTDTTITDPRGAGRELAATRARGYGVCAGELESSLYGVSAPVLDRAGRPLAVLSIWGPKDRVQEEPFAELGAVAVRAAAPVVRPIRPGTTRAAGAGGPGRPVAACAGSACGFMIVVGCGNGQNRSLPAPNWRSRSAPPLWRRVPGQRVLRANGIPSPPTLAPWWRELSSLVPLAQVMEGISCDLGTSRVTPFRELPVASPGTAARCR